MRISVDQSLQSRNAVNFIYLCLLMIFHGRHGFSFLLIRHKLLTLSKCFKSSVEKDAKIVI